MNLKSVWKRYLGLFMALVLLCALLAGCGEMPAEPSTEPQRPSENKDPEQIVNPQTPATESESLTALRRQLAETGKAFAVAYFGYMNADENMTAQAYLQTRAWQLCQQMPFLQEIQTVVGDTCGELYCIVPAEGVTDLVVTGSVPGEDGMLVHDRQLYAGGTDAPILLFCNGGGGTAFVEVRTENLVWDARLSDYRSIMPLYNEEGENLILDFSPYWEGMAIDYYDMVDSGWEFPVHEDLIGTCWSWDAVREDGRYEYYEVRFDETTAHIEWNDGIDEENHVYPDATWELTYDEGMAIVTFDFREMAGVRSYDVLMLKQFDQLYIMMDVLSDFEGLGTEDLYRYMARTEETAYHTSAEMVGSWERYATEVEGDFVNCDPGVATVTITDVPPAGADAEDFDTEYWITYTDREYPELSYGDVSLLIMPSPNWGYFSECDWIAAINHIGTNGTSYLLTILKDGTLMIQNQWEMDGAPMVGYEFYRKINE